MKTIVMPVFLFLCIISYGLVGVAQAQSTELPLSVNTDYPAYADNGEIVITGKVRASSLSEYKTPITIQIFNPDGNMVALDQKLLDTNNEYSLSIIAGGSYWKAAGEYIVKAKYGAQTAETTFNFVGSESTPPPPPPVVITPTPPVVTTPTPPPPPPPPPPELMCGEGTVLQDGKCVIEEVPEPVIVEPEPEPEPMCGEGTVLTDGKCVAEEKGGGCLIATAAFGSEMAPQVQFLREIRDNTVLQTQSGISFMTGFNQFYYSFSPAIADYERENPVFKEAVKLTLTPLLTSLTLLNYVDIDTESEMLGYGIGVILLNIGMYFVAPAAIIIAIKNRRK